MRAPKPDVWLRFLPKTAIWSNIPGNFREGFDLPGMLTYLSVGYPRWPNTLSRFRDTDHIANR